MFVLEDYDEDLACSRKLGEKFMQTQVVAVWVVALCNFHQWCYSWLHSSAYADVCTNEG